MEVSVRISHKHRFVFFSSPKTGSKSVRTMLFPYSDVRILIGPRRMSMESPFHPHMPPKEAKAAFEERGWPFEEYRKFVFVRNPWARLASLYEMIFRRQVKPSFTPWLHAIKTHGSGGGGGPHATARKYGTYSLGSFVTDDDESVLVDKVIRLEDIHEELIPFLVTLGLPGIDALTIPHANARSHPHYSTYYTTKDRRLVAALYAEEIEEYGYRFERGTS